MSAPVEPPQYRVECENPDFLAAYRANTTASQLFERHYFATSYCLYEDCYDFSFSGTTPDLVSWFVYDSETEQLIKPPTGKACQV